MQKNRRVLLASRPSGWVSEANFRIDEAPLPSPAEGEVLVKNLWLSLDPYMRGRMNEGKSYAAKQEIGAVMIGGTVGEVVESKNAKFAKGDKVLGMLGWQQYALSDGKGLNKVDASRVPLPAYLGVLGMPGVTAWVGLLDLCQPKSGETVLVSAASGAVGSVVGQIAKIKGCRAIGIAGGRQKCDYVVKELGFDACVDYKAGALNDELKAAAPDGIDCYFENVGGEILDAALRRMNAFSRIAVCGLISQYNATEPYGVKNFQSILTNRIKVQGFIVSDRMELWPKALADLAGWVVAGRIKYRETVTEGLENAPRAFIGLLKGENLGKQLVRLG
ncbi:MAG: NADPH-dependent curcumin reductase [Betaproteobacteria bacterium]|jgi:leukotriene B4 12-hydroxydehydrogenase/15-oxo-prostaglandin 13-reductase|nr:NADPH-dependent curcumin reductase [Betaproteobacteria bacterium]